MSTSDFSQRVALASHATGGNKPSTAMALANSDLNDSDVQLVGTFIQGMGTSLVARLARASGATTNFSPDQRSQLDALKEQYADVDASAQKDAADPRGWLAKAFDVVSSGIGTGLETAVSSDYSPLHWALTGFDKALDAVKLPVRILSSAIDTSNNDEIDQQMTAQGYDKGNAWDYVQFMYNQGDSVFHDLDPLREEYTPEAVDLAMQFYADPDKFNQLQQTDPGFAQKVSEITSRPDWNDVLDHVDRKHISVGRDIANLVLPKSAERGALFTAMSGTLDAAFTLAADPTLIAGKAGLIARAADVGAESVMKGTGTLAALRPSNQVARAIDFARNGAQRRGVATIRDQAGIKQLFTKGTDVGNSAAAFLEDANKLRTLTDEGQKAALLAGMRVRHKGWMPFLDEVSGRKLVIPEHELVERAVPGGAVGHSAAGPENLHRDVLQASGQRSVDGKLPLSVRAFQENATSVARGDKPIDGILKDVNGIEHFTRQGNAITTVEDFGDYLASTTGLLRMGNGYAAQAGRMLPGKTTWRLALEDKIGRAKMAERRVNKTYAKREEAYQGITWDHSDAAAGKLSRYMPVKEEASLLDEIDQLDEGLLSDAKTRGTVIRNVLETGRADGAAGGFRHPTLRGDVKAAITKARANWERRARRMSTLLPTVTHLDVNAVDGAEQVRSFGRLYLNRTDADRLAAMWANGDTAARRAVARGMLEQSFEASGLTLSEAGQEFISRFRLDQAQLDRQMYGFDGTDVVKTERGDVHMALYPSQLSDRIALPSFRDMHYIASKFSSASYFTKKVGARFYAPTMDRALTGIKMGWITSPASGLRNALDELVGVVVRGGGGDMLKARVLYTSETRAWRKTVRRDSKRYQDLLKKYGTAKTHEILGAEVKSAGDRVREAGGSLSEVREAERAAVLEARIKHRIPLALRGAADKVNDVVFHELLGRYYSVRGAFRGDESAYVRELVELQKANLVNRTIGDTRFGDDAQYLSDNEGALRSAQKGVLSAPYGFRPDGWQKIEVDGGAGIDSLAENIGLKFGDGAGPAHEALRGLWEHDADTAVQNVLAYLELPQARNFVSRLESLKWTKDGRRALSPEELQAAKQDYAERLVADVKLTVTGRGLPHYTNEQVDATRRWMGEKTREDHGQRAMAGEGRQSDLDRQAEDALSELHAAREERDALKAGTRLDTEKGRLAERRTASEQRLQKLRDKRDRLEGKPHPDQTTRVRLEQDLTKAQAEYERQSRRLAEARARRDRAGKPRQPDPERLDYLRSQVTERTAEWRQAVRSKADKAEVQRTRHAMERARNQRDAFAQPRKASGDKLDQLRSGVRQVEADHRRARKAYLSAKRDHEEAAGTRKVTPEQLIHARERVTADEARHDRLVKQHKDAAARQAEAGGKTDPEALAEAQARVESAKKAYDNALRLSHRNGRNVENSTVLERDHEFAGHVDDQHIKKYLRDVQGVEPRPGEFGNGQINGELAELLLAGEIPGRDFLARMPAEHLPRYAMKQQFAPILPGGNLERLAGNYTELLAKAYSKVVTDQVAAISRNPLLTSKYVEARRATAEYERHLVDDLGWDKDLASQTAQKIALSHAEQEVIKQIDNPQVASQFSVISRNFWAFERAQEDALRRWVRTIRDHPEAIRKMQLGVHAGQAAGIVHTDDQGHLTFTYPGSGAILTGINKLFSAIGLSDQVSVPVIPDLSSRLTFVNASLDNPVGFSATPIISIPFKALAATFGDDYPVLMSSMDRVVNGELGAQRSWYEQLLPTPIMRVLDGVISKDPASRFGSAYMQAISNLEMSGAMENLDKNGTDPGAKEKLLQTLRAQITNNMIGTTLFGLFAPATPGNPENTVDGDWLAAQLKRSDYSSDQEYEAAMEHARTNGAGKADWNYHKQGLASLKDEARVIFSQMDYADAMAWWTTHHPGELIAAPTAAASTTKMTGGAEQANGFATLTAASWMGSNRAWMLKYPGVSAYFIPQGDPSLVGGKYSPLAYQAQESLGIREKKSFDEFIDGIITARGERIYYDTKRDYDTQIARAQSAGNKPMVSQLQDQWAQEKQYIYAGNPLLAAKNAKYAEASTQREQQLLQLVHLMNDPVSYKAVGKQADGVQQLIDTYTTYVSQRDSIKGERGSTASSKRAKWQAEYADRLKLIVQAYPGLKDLSDGVFDLPG